MLVAAQVFHEAAHIRGRLFPAYIRGVASYYANKLSAVHS